METLTEESQPIEFVVGETYENEKGVFEVLSIQRDAMVIQWENGESIETTVSFQRRIQERRRWERQRREKLAAAAGAKGRRAARKAGKRASLVSQQRPNLFIPGEMFAKYLIR